MTNKFETMTVDEIYREVEFFLKNELVIKRAACHSEDDAQYIITSSLEKKFGLANVLEQAAVGGNLKLACDIDLFDGRCGIELKMAKTLEEKATELQRTIGQIFYYSKRRYNSTNLILLVVGNNEELTAKLKELKEMVEYFPNVHFIYKLTEKYKRK